MSLCDPCKLLVNFLEWANLYEPVIDIEEAQRRLASIKPEWERFTGSERGGLSGPNTSPLSPFVVKSLSHLTESNTQGRVAVDLGCGLGSTPFRLCNMGWKVYAVDSSPAVISLVTAATQSLRKNWIEEGQLKLTQSRIEDFEYPEQVDLIIATNSLPYCDPTKIAEIFHKAKTALKEGGVFAAEFFPPNPQYLFADLLLKRNFGGWITTKNVIDAVAQFTGFKEVTVCAGRSPSGIAPQIHVFAKA